MAVKQGTVAGRSDPVDEPRQTELSAVAAFNEIALRVTREPDLGRVLHLITERLCALVGISRCSMFLRDKDGPLFLGAVGHSPIVDDKIKRLVSGTEADRFSREVIETRAPVLIRDTHTDPRVIRRRMLEWNVRSILGVPMVIDGNVLGILYLDNAEEPFEFTDAHLALATTFANLAGIALVNVQLVRDLRKNVQLVRTKNQLLERSAAIEERLTNLALTGADVAQIVRVVAELTGKLCAITDNEFKLLAQHGPEGAEGWQLPILDPATRGSAPVLEALASVGDQSTAIVPARLHSGIHRRLLVAPLRVRDDDLGHLWIEERPSAFGQLDTVVARHASTVIALELSAELRAAAAEHDARTTVANELLRGEGGEALSRRARYLGMPVDTPYVVCLFRAAAVAEQADLRDEPVLATFAEFLPEQPLLTTPIVEGVAAIVSLDPGQPRRAAVDQVCRVCEEVCARIGPGARAAVSTPFTGAPAASDAYAEALSFMTCHDALGAAAPTVLSADRLGPARVLLSSGDPAAIDRFLDETLGELNTGRRSHLAMLATLGAFFDESQHVRHASDRIGVHENTVRYRVRRVQEITGLSLDDPVAQMSLQMAVMLSRLRGALGPADVMRDEDPKPQEGSAGRRSPSPPSPPSARARSALPAARRSRR